MPSEERARICEFGPFRYDPAQRLLFRGGEVVPLAPKAIDTLHVLLERRGQVVEKADLMRLVWPDCTVEDVGLARNISLLRKALGDDQEQFIATIPRRGYRFVAEVTEPDAAGQAPAGTGAPGSGPGGPRREGELTSERPAGRRLWSWFAVVLALAVAVVLVYWQFYSPSRYLPAGEGFADVAVLPVECLSPELDRAAFCRGFTEVLAGEIAKLDRVHVIAQSTVRRYEQFHIAAPVMARMLRLDATVEGSAQLLGSRLSISLRLKDVHSGKLIWAENYARDAADLGQAQTDVARSAAAQLRAALAPRAPGNPTSR